MRARLLTACVAAFAVLGGSAQASGPPDFEPAVRLSPALPHPHYSDPDLAVGDGRVVAVWTRFRTGTRSWVQAVELDANAHPGPVSSIEASPDSGFTNDPVVALSGAGRAAVVWDGGPDFLGVDARLSVLETDLTPTPTQTLGKGYDPVVAYPASGNGLIAWSSAGGVSVAAIDPLGDLGPTNLIPSPAIDPTIEIGRDGGKVYWSNASGVFEAPVTTLGEPGPVTEILPPNGLGYRNLVVSDGLLTALQEGGRRRKLLCAPLAGGNPRTIDAGPVSDAGSIRVGSVDVDAVGSHGLIGWVKRSPAGGPWRARVATVDQRCHVSGTSALPSPGRRAYDTQVGRDSGSPLALVAGGGGIEAVNLWRSGRVRSSERIPRTRPISKKLDRRNPIRDLELSTVRGAPPIAIWTAAHRGPGETIAASIAR